MCVNDSNLNFFFNSAVKNHQNGNFEEAEKFYKKVIEINPDLVATHNNLANTLKALNRLDESEVSFKKSIALKSEFVDIIKKIKEGDWETSKHLLETMCTKKIFDTRRNIKEFISLWCAYCRKLLTQGDLNIFIKIFTKLFTIGERNQDLNNLVIYFFDKIDIDTALELVKFQDKILINLSYCYYKFEKKDFSQAQTLASLNIDNAMKLLRSFETENLGWLIIRRSLTLCKNKNFAREKLNGLFFKLELIK